MARLFLVLIILLAAVSCSKKEETSAENIAQTNETLPYDTTAIDSFAPGATPSNVIMNRVIVDSATLAKREAEKILAKKKKEAEAGAADDAKKKAAEKKQKPAPKTESAQQSSNETNP